jgi:hypothetical protein
VTLEELLAQAGQMQPPEMQPQGLDLSALMGPMMPPMDFSGFQPGGQQVPEPNLTVSPLHANFLDRLGLAFQQLPPVNTSQSGGASLLQGLMQGFGASRGGGFQRQEQQNTAENARLSESARNMAQTRWRNYQMEAQRLKAKRDEAVAQVANDRAARNETRLTAAGLRAEEAARRQERYLQLAEAKAGAPKTIDPTDKLKFINTLQDNIRQDPDVGGFVTIRDSYGVGKDAASMGNSAGDIVLMRMIAKVTDPTTGVREEEYRTFQGAQGSLARLGMKFSSDMVGKGQLTAVGRAALKGQLERIYQRKLANHREALGVYRKQAEAYGIDPTLVIRRYQTPTTVDVVAPDGKTYSFPDQGAADAFKKKAGIQ